jgi:hypothetical protein
LLLLFNPDKTVLVITSLLHADRAKATGILYIKVVVRVVNCDFFSVFDLPKADESQCVLGDWTVLFE